jgi:hypothetical protein
MGYEVESWHADEVTTVVAQEGHAEGDRRRCLPGISSIDTVTNSLALGPNLGPGLTQGTIWELNAELLEELIQGGAPQWCSIAQRSRSASV